MFVPGLIIINVPIKPIEIPKKRLMPARSFLINKTFLVRIKLNWTALAKCL